MLKLNTMLAQRHFRKQGVDEQGREHWSRGNIHVYRYSRIDHKVKPTVRKKYVTIEYTDKAGKVEKSITYELNDPAVHTHIVSLTIPNIEESVGKSQKAITASFLLERAMSAFDEWYTMVGANPAMDIESYFITMTINEIPYRIPLVIVEAANLTGEYLQNLLELYKEERL